MSCQIKNLPNGKIIVETPTNKESKLYQTLLNVTKDEIHALELYNLAIIEKSKYQLDIEGEPIYSPKMVKSRTIINVSNNDALYIQRANKIIKETFGNTLIEVAPINRLLVNLANNNVAMGAYANKILYLSENSNEDTVWHEVFHITFRNYLTKPQIESILEYAPKSLKLTEEVIQNKMDSLLYKYPQYNELSNTQLKNLALEEFLSEDFVKYKNDKKTFKGYFKNLWNQLVNLITGLFGKTDLLRDLYKRIDNKYFVGKNMIDNVDYFSALPVFELYQNNYIEGQVTKYKDQFYTDFTFSILFKVLEEMSSGTLNKADTINKVINDITNENFIDEDDDFSIFKEDVLEDDNNKEILVRNLLDLISNFNFHNSIYANNDSSITDEADEEFTNSDSLSESYMLGENKVPPLNVNLISILFKYLPSKGIFRGQTQGENSYSLKHFEAIDLESFQNLLTNSILSKTSKTPGSVFKRLLELKDNIGNLPYHSAIVKNIVNSIRNNFFSNKNDKEFKDITEKDFNELFDEKANSFIKSDAQSEMITLINLLISLPTSAVTNAYTVATDKGITNYTTTTVNPSFQEWYYEGVGGEIDLHFETGSNAMFIFEGNDFQDSKSIQGKSMKYFEYVSTLEQFKDIDDSIVLKEENNNKQYLAIKESYDNNYNAGIKLLEKLVKESKEGNEESKKESIKEFLRIVSVAFPLINLNSGRLIEAFLNSKNKDLKIDNILKLIKENSFQFTKSTTNAYNTFHTHLYNFLKANNLLTTSDKITEVFSQKGAAVRLKNLGQTAIPQHLRDNTSEFTLIKGMIPIGKGSTPYFKNLVETAFNIGNMKVGLDEDTSKTISHTNLATQIFLSALNPVQDLDAKVTYSLGEITQPESKVTRYGYMIPWNVKSVNKESGLFEYDETGVMNYSFGTAIKTKINGKEVTTYDWITNAFLYNLKTDVKQFVDAIFKVQDFFKYAQSILKAINEITKEKIITFEKKKELAVLYDKLDAIQLYKDYHLKDFKDVSLKDIDTKTLDLDLKNKVFRFSTIKEGVTTNHNFELGRAFSVFQTKDILSDKLFLDKVIESYERNSDVNNEADLINIIHNDLISDKITIDSITEENINLPKIVEAFKKSVQSVYNEIEDNFTLRNGDNYSPYGIQFNGKEIAFKDSEGNDIINKNGKKKFDSVNYELFVKSVIAANMVFASSYDKIINNEYAINKNKVDKYKRAGSSGGMIKNSQGIIYALVIPNKEINNLYINGKDTKDLDTADAQGFQIPSSHFKFNQDYGYNVRHNLDMRKIEWKLRTGVSLSDKEVQLLAKNGVILNPSKPLGVDNKYYIKTSFYTITLEEVAFIPKKNQVEYEDLLDELEVLLESKEPSDKLEEILNYIEFKIFNLFTPYDTLTDKYDIYKKLLYNNLQFAVYQSASKKLNPMTSEAPFIRMEGINFGEQVVNNQIKENIYLGYQLINLIGLEIDANTQAELYDEVQLFKHYFGELRNQLIKQVEAIKDLNVEDYPSLKLLIDRMRTQIESADGGSDVLRVYSTIDLLETIENTNKELSEAVLYNPDLIQFTNKFQQLFLTLDNKGAYKIKLKGGKYTLASNTNNYIYRKTIALKDLKALLEKNENKTEFLGADVFLLDYNKVRRNDVLGYNSVKKSQLKENDSFHYVKLGTELNDVNEFELKHNDKDTHQFKISRAELEAIIEAAEEDNKEEILIQDRLRYSMQIGVQATQAEVIAPMTDEIKALLNSDGTVKKGKELAYQRAIEIFGVRIPTQDKHSMTSARIIDFLPAALGTSLLVPHELYKLSGADNDVDGLFVYKHIVKNGKLPSNSRNKEVVLEKYDIIINNSYLSELLEATLDNNTKENLKISKKLNKYINIINSYRITEHSSKDFSDDLKEIQEDLLYRLEELDDLMKTNLASEALQESDRFNIDTYDEFLDIVLQTIKTTKYTFINKYRKEIDSIISSLKVNGELAYPNGIDDFQNEDYLNNKIVEQLHRIYRKTNPEILYTPSSMKITEHLKKAKNSVIKKEEGNENPFFIVNIIKSNRDNIQGKDGIGVSASNAMVHTLLSKQYSDSQDSGLKDAVLKVPIKLKYNEDLKSFESMSNMTVTIDNYFKELWEDKIKKGTFNKESFKHIEAYYQEYEADESEEEYKKRKVDILSTLISIATDNAKELQMNNLNFKKEVLHIIGSLVDFNVPLHTIFLIANSSIFIKYLNNLQPIKYTLNQNDFWVTIAKEMGKSVSAINLLDISFRTNEDDYNNFMIAMNKYIVLKGGKYVVKNDKDVVLKKYIEAKILPYINQSISEATKKDVITAYNVGKTETEQITDYNSLKNNNKLYGFLSENESKENFDKYLIDRFVTDPNSIDTNDYTEQDLEFYLLLKYVDKGIARNNKMMNDLLGLMKGNPSNFEDVEFKYEDAIKQLGINVDLSNKTLSITETDNSVYESTSLQGVLNNTTNGVTGANFMYNNIAAFQNFINNITPNYIISRGKWFLDTYDLMNSDTQLKIELNNFTGKQFKIAFSKGFQTYLESHLYKTLKKSDLETSVDGVKDDSLIFENLLNITSIQNYMRDTVDLYNEVLSDISKLKTTDISYDYFTNNSVLKLTNIGKELIEGKSMKDANLSVLFKQFFNLTPNQVTQLLEDMDVIFTNSHSANHNELNNSLKELVYRLLNLSFNINGMSATPTNASRYIPSKILKKVSDKQFELRLLLNIKNLFVYNKTTEKWQIKNDETSKYNNLVKIYNKRFKDFNISEYLDIDSDIESFNKVVSQNILNVLGVNVGANPTMSELDNKINSIRLNFIQQFMMQEKFENELKTIKITVDWNEDNIKAKLNDINLKDNLQGDEKKLNQIKDNILKVVNSYLRGLSPKMFFDFNSGLNTDRNKILSLIYRQIGFLKTDSSGNSIMPLVYKIEGDKNTAYKEDAFYALDLDNNITVENENIIKIDRFKNTKITPIKLKARTNRVNTNRMTAAELKVFTSVSSQEYDKLEIALKYLDDKGEITQDLFEQFKILSFKDVSHFRLTEDLIENYLNQYNKDLDINKKLEMIESLYEAINSSDKKDFLSKSFYVDFTVPKKSIRSTKQSDLAELSKLFNLWRIKNEAFFTGKFDSGETELENSISNPLNKFKAVNSDYLYSPLVELNEEGNIESAALKPSNLLTTLTLAKESNRLLLSTTDIKESNVLFLLNVNQTETEKKEKDEVKKKEPSSVTNTLKTLSSLSALFKTVKPSFLLDSTDILISEKSELDENNQPVISYGEKANNFKIEGDEIEEYFKDKKNTSKGLYKGGEGGVIRYLLENGYKEFPTNKKGVSIYIYEGNTTAMNKLVNKKQIAESIDKDMKMVEKEDSNSIKGLNERLDNYGFTRLILSTDFYEGDRPKGRLNFFKTSIRSVSDNLQILVDLKLDEFDFLTEKDKERLNNLRPKAIEFKNLNMLISSKLYRTEDLEKRYAILSNEIINEFVDIIGIHVEQQLGKKIKVETPKRIVDNNQNNQPETTESKTPVFDSLPITSNVPTMTYAGIGSRETPQEILELMTKAAKYLETQGYTLRSGGAKGADTAFEQEVTKKEIFKGFDKTGNKEVQIAHEIHPNLKGAMEASKNKKIKSKLTEGVSQIEADKLGEKSALAVENLMARNTNQIFGKNLDTPVDFVLAYDSSGWTGKGDRPKKGGTLQAIDLAARKGIPVINMANPNWRSELDTILKTIKNKTETPTQQTTNVVKKIEELRKEAIEKATTQNSHWSTSLIIDKDSGLKKTWWSKGDMITDINAGKYDVELQENNKDTTNLFDKSLVLTQQVTINNDDRVEYLNQNMGNTLFYSGKVGYDKIIFSFNEREDSIGFIIEPIVKEKEGYRIITGLYNVLVDFDLKWILETVGKKSGKPFRDRIIGNNGYIELPSSLDYDVKKWKIKKLDNEIKFKAIMKAFPDYKLLYERLANPALSYEILKKAYDNQDPILIQTIIDAFKNC